MTSVPVRQELVADSMNAETEAERIVNAICTVAETTPAILRNNKQTGKSPYTIQRRVAVLMICEAYGGYAQGRVAASEVLNIALSNICTMYACTEIQVNIHANPAYVSLMEAAQYVLDA